MIASLTFPVSSDLGVWVFGYRAGKIDSCNRGLLADLTFSDGSTTRLFDNGPRWTPVLHLVGEPARNSSRIHSSTQDLTTNTGSSHVVPVLILAALIFTLTCHPPSSHYAHQFWTYSTSLSQSLPKLSLILSSANAFLVFVLLILDVGLYTTARDQINSHAIGLGQVAGSNGVTEQTRAQLGTNIWLLVFGTVAVLTEFSVLAFWYVRRGRKAY